jgi:hypothetical protein
MPDKEGKQSGPGIKDTPDQAYKSGRSEDVQEGSLGADTGGAGVQKSRLPEGSDEAGTTQSGGFGGQEADDAPDAGTVGSASGEGDASPHRDPDATKKDEAGGDLSAGEGAKDPAPGSLGNASDEEVGQRGYGQQPDYDANDPDARQQHPKTPSDMGSR